MKKLKRSLAATLALLLAALGCRTYFPVNEALDPGASTAEGYRSNRRWSPDRSNQLLVVLAFSGGGTRAAAFAFGVLEELDATPIQVEGREALLLDEVDHITGVSGGSFPAAYFGLKGRDIFRDFEPRFLDRNVQRALILQLLWPWNWGLLFSPYFERSDLVARYYDRILFDDATFGDMAARSGPLIQINATDLATGAPFSFIQDQFDYLCSDVAAYPISRAVAASSAVPGPMSPLTLRNFGGECAFEPPAWVRREGNSSDSFGRRYSNARNLDSYLDSERRRFIRLVDGGVSDNLGVRGPFESNVLEPPADDTPPGSLRDLRHVLFVLVNAATTPEAAWESLDKSPPLAEIIGQTTTVQINRYSIETIELLRTAFSRWNAVASKWPEPAHFHLVEIDFGKPSDPEERRYLNSQPTSFHLDEEAVDRLRVAGRRSLRESPIFQDFLSALGGGGGKALAPESPGEGAGP